MKKTLSLIGAAIICLLSTGCASILSKSTYPLSISSNPNSNIVVTNSKGVEIYKGNTPATVTLKSGDGFFKRAEYQIKFTQAGYNEKVVPVTFKVDGWYWGNLLLGGILGMLIVDPATGAMYKLEQDYINETLSQSVASTDSKEFKILSIDEIPDNLKSKLQLIK
ncbi:hypothetical protein [Roseivirga thermotolerans]|uniref:PEGA domain-containing protein n=1 Tax=Roseivirga thermotolerans TaxID=1758176 RepID=A0ABQ3I2T1_9BACT|nr:hypothetical protein [Roseivirga thermotolerans]GHE59342.1 hypothetical protein GCM10011340_12470 [Roseivirga thermotolerans]